MGNLANMTDNDGRVSGPRLLRWLRSGEQICREAASEARAESHPVLAAWNSGRADLLREMADDLERELTPPDYPGDGADAVNLDARDTWPCEGCGQMADRVLVQDNGRSWFACPDCAARVDRDAVDLDDPIFLGRPEQE